MKDTTIQYSAKANNKKNIKEYFDRTNESYSQFAKAFGVSNTSVKRWINGVCSPEIELLPYISEYLGISILELFGLPTPNPLSPDEIQILRLYKSNSDFKILINQYQSDPKFKEHIDYIVHLLK